MKEIAEKEKQEASLKSIQVKKTLEYEVDEGTVQERVTVNYNADKGNAIDNAVNTIKTNETVHKVASTAKSAAQLAITLVVL